MGRSSTGVSGRDPGASLLLRFVIQQRSAADCYNTDLRRVSTVLLLGLLGYLVNSALYQDEMLSLHTTAKGKIWQASWSGL